MLLSHLREVPKQSRSWIHLWWPAWTMGALGIARGLDEGIIAGVLTQKSFKSAFQFESDSAVENDIASMLQAGSIIGSVLAFLVSDYVGRRRTAQLACLLWILGTSIWFSSAHKTGEHSGNLSQLLAGRFIAGLGVGITPVVAPTYLAEIAPRAIRGLCVCIFSGSVYLGILLGYWSNYGTSRGITDTSGLQWQVPASLNFIFAGLIFISSFFIPESPRWLLKVSREDDARKALDWLRHNNNDDLLIAQEFDDMAGALEQEREARGQKAWYHLFTRLVTNRTNLHVLCIGIGIQVFGQFSGGGSMTVFAPKIFGYVGITGSETKLFTTGIFGIVKLLSSMAAAFFIVDLLGRKFAVMFGLSIQAVASLYLALYLRFHYGDSVDGETTSTKMMADVAIFFIFLSGFAWAIGVNSVQYLSQTEMFSLESRSLGVAIISVLHFLCQFGSSRSVNPIVNSGGPYALFVFFFVMSIVSLVFVFFMMPEVSGYPLERIKELFEKKKWYLIGCTQNRPLRVKDMAALGDDVPKLGMEVTHQPSRMSQDGEKEKDAKDEADPTATQIKTVDA
ncbi:hypothetical protein CBS101457_002258 [Exobasidium rhododendri]|nr:hypothetical protein CBS101457_002258 [Exobasidium rhododendri]